MENRNKTLDFLGIVSNSGYIIDLEPLERVIKSYIKYH
jgi:hypothetical protein